MFPTKTELCGPNGPSLHGMKTAARRIVEARLRSISKHPNRAALWVRHGRSAMQGAIRDVRAAAEDQWAAWQSLTPEELAAIRIADAEGHPTATQRYGRITQLLGKNPCRDARDILALRMSSNDAAHEAAKIYAAAVLFVRGMKAA